jgi:tetratricopeptide (TPR) repeat protein
MEDAKKYARQMLDEARTNKDETQILRAEFLLARILDDNKERNEAKALLADFVARNPGDENFETALSTLVMQRFEDKEYAEALQSLNIAVAMQDKLPPEKRSYALSGFALFWSGRIYAATKRFDMANAVWRRLATEFYSTYYGVLGHVLYERATGKKVMIEPSRTPKFSQDFLTAAYSGEDKTTMARVGALFRLGMASDAICELREVATTNGDLEQTAARALALYAGKEWLDAIKLMDALPRAYRNSLPLGFERIFFPREHENLIFDYARRLRVDPDFIFALIRQESVCSTRRPSPRSVPQV